MASVRKRSWLSSGEKKSARTVDYRDNAGTRRSKTFARKKDADAWLIKASHQVSQGMHTADSQSITVARAAELWLEDRRSEGLEESTLAAYEQHIRLHIVPLCGAVKLSQMTAPIVKGYRDSFVRTLSRPMAIRVFRSFKAIFAQAVGAGYVAANVCTDVRIARAKKGRKARSRFRSRVSSAR